MSLEVGARAEVKRSYTEDDMRGFAQLAGNDTEVPVSVPGPLIGGLFSYLLGVELPGRGTNYLKQSLEFLAPAPVGETLTASVTITRLRPEKHLVDLETVCEAEDGTRICQGRALVYVEDVGKD
ncbi:phosphate acetyltransferase [Labrenzia sp. C1B10]|jgi:acyl dehydratase|uniref:phosphate acetyltransferase n=1 Tax=Stappiaceae TaxID=2821832 RepID=UPI0003B88A11|nr:MULTISPECIES: phosphate acetyltransferase [Stappiaceae]ERP86238.1 phosphate acetyltransferase [Labrenzia sp. C1B10]ERS06752.1 phosphate acetyltransferase [Labrenzia sp. C1B70]UES49433.1 phosphate acetyltransferase [Roseibium aggregatum]